MDQFNCHAIGETFERNGVPSTSGPLFNRTDVPLDFSDVFVFRRRVEADFHSTQIRPQGLEFNVAVYHIQLEASSNVLGCAEL